LRSLSVKETFKSNTEQVLAFLVESGTLYLAIWVRPNPCPVLPKLGHVYLLADRRNSYYGTSGIAWDRIFPSSSRPICCKTYLDSHFLDPLTGIESRQQGMYPTMIVVVVALRLSTADVLSRNSRSGPEGNSFIVFTTPSSSPAQPQLAKDIRKNSLDGRSTPVSFDAASI